MIGALQRTLDCYVADEQSDETKGRRIVYLVLTLAVILIPLTLIPTFASNTPLNQLLGFPFFPSLAVLCAAITIIFQVAFGRRTEHEPKQTYDLNKIVNDLDNVEQILEKIADE